MVLKGAVQAGLILAAGASFGAAGVLFYFLLKRDDMLKYEERIIKSTKHCTVEIEIPKDLVGAFIGRQGSHIKLLQEETNTRINFRDDDNEDDEKTSRTAVIRGSSDDVKVAKERISNFIINQPKIVTEEIHVPQNACGMLIGRNGDNIRQMCKLSKAKITIESLDTSSKSNYNTSSLVTLRGNVEHIEAAKIMIHEKLMEAEERYRKNMEMGERKRQAMSHDNANGRKTSFDDIKHQLALTAPVSDKQDDAEDEMCERLIATGKDGFTEVYLSAAANPSKFWVQVVGVRSTALDTLVETMTKFYSDQQNTSHSLVKTGEIDKLKVGDVIAAPFSHDKSWYRVEIVDISYDDYDPNICNVELYYLDFGDTCVFDVKQLCLLKQEFMQLPFQAIECQLANVQPVNGSDWPESAIDVFEDLAYVAQWKVVMAKTVDYIKTSGKRKIHVVELVDTNNECDVDVAEQLIAQGMARKLI